MIYRLLERRVEERFGMETPREITPSVSSFESTSRRGGDCWDGSTGRDAYGMMYCFVIYAILVIETKAKHTKLAGKNQAVETHREWEQLIDQEVHQYHQIRPRQDASSSTFTSFSPPSDLYHQVEADLESPETPLGEPSPRHASSTTAVVQSPSVASIALKASTSLQSWWIWIRG